MNDRQTTAAGRFLLVAILGAAIAGSSACGPYVPPVPPKTWNVDVEVTHSWQPCNVDLTFSFGDERTEQEADRDVPWTRRGHATTGDRVYVSAQNQCDFGEVLVTVRFEGGPVETVKAVGPYAIATLNVRAP